MIELVIAELSKFHRLPIGDVADFFRDLSPHHVAGLLGPDDKILLHKLGCILPPGSIVVEIGSYLGASAAIVAHSNPDVILHCYDLFDDKIYDGIHREMLDKFLGKDADRSFDAVSNLVSVYPNITMHKVAENDCPIFDFPIDLFIEDASHRNPQLGQALNLWMPRIKVGGILLIHDYRPWLDVTDKRRYRDVDEWVDMLSIDKHWEFCGSIGSYAILRKIDNVF